MNYIDLFFSYRKIIFQVLFYEIFFSLKYREFKPRIKIQNNNFITDTIPCIYYFLFNISKFIKKNNIQSVVDLGSGFGRIINFINNENKIKSIGIEIDKDVYRQSIQLKSEKVKIYNNDILKIDLSKFKSECFILNDPLKKEKNKKKLRNKIKKLKKKIIKFM